ncbi:MAG: DUF3617 family protein [Proteobacteria bacterium]|nr:DUF3617 family protein [Pseudomonadota bacterium]HQR03693.1 DUF3617 family protein [Rhodocyclaceae bacterium]
MGKLKLWWLVLCLGGVPLLAGAAGNDELWEITTRMNIQGMGMQGGGATVKSCLTKGNAYNPDQGREAKNCKFTELKVVGNKTSWQVRCTGKEEMSGSGEMTKTATTLEGTIRMNTHGMAMVQNISGHKVGSCDAATDRPTVMGHGPVRP